MQHFKAQQKLLTHSVKICSLFILAACFQPKEPAKKEVKALKTATLNLETDSHGMSKTQATIKTTHGDIVFKFYPEQAPKTVARFMELAQQGFYNGLMFHRVIPNFVIQGGDPQGTGMGGSGQKLKAEFSDIQHIKGDYCHGQGQRYSLCRQSILYRFEHSAPSRQTIHCLWPSHFWIKNPG